MTIDQVNEVVRRAGKAAAGKCPTVAFLLLGPVTHIHHVASIAFELAARGDVAVTIFVASELNLRTTLQLAQAYGSPCAPVMLRADRIHEAVRWFKRRMHPRVRRVLSNNAEMLRKFDALVFTDRNPLGRELRGPSLLYVGHGVGDRRAGTFPEMSDFDGLLMPGPARWRSAEAQGYVSVGRGTVIGSAKLDLIKRMNPANSKLFSNDRPVVLYNPHFNRRESSWWTTGKAILEYFSSQQDYNLVFAPHALLFAKQRFDTRKYRGSENILIDTDSPALIDMSYTRAADIYLGDVSSQVYEFVGWNYRPCIFLRTHGEAWEGNDAFAMWRMGQIVSDMAGLHQALQQARGTLPNYLPEQRRLCADQFGEVRVGASQRGGDAIARYLAAGRATAMPWAATEFECG